MTPTVQILTGSALTVLRTLPNDSIQCVVTSPPYYGLRDYGVAGQLGLEPTPALFIEHLVAVFDEVKRVLRPDGVCFVNIGDSYAGSGKGPTTAASTLGSRGGRGVLPTDKVVTRTAQLRQGFCDDYTYTGIPAKNLLLIPERFALAMQEAGWIVRSRIAWCKTSAMPESVRDRPTSAWEHIWMFTKSPRYFWDAGAVKQPTSENTHARKAQGAAAPSMGPKIAEHGLGIKSNGSFSAATSEILSHANLRNFWLLGPEPFKEAHFATFPSEIPRRCIKAATSEQGQCRTCGRPYRRVVETTYTPSKAGGPHGKIGDAWRDPAQRTDLPTVRLSRHDETLGWQPSCSCAAGDPVPQTVLDPFLGSGTTALVAHQLGRSAIGIELSPTYAEMARRRIADSAPMLTAGAVRVEDAPFDFSQGQLGLEEA